MLEQAARHDAVGALLRQPRIRLPDGSQSLFDELLGRDFAIVGRTRNDCELNEESRELFGRLRGRAIALEDVDVLEEELDRAFDSSPAVVLRPDRIVFGVVEEGTSLDHLISTLGRLLQIL